MAQKNYYTILGIEQTAAPDDIKKAYRKLAFKYHPDHNKGGFSGEEQFKEIKEAYETLMNPAKRRELDLSLKAQHIYAPSYNFGKYTSPDPNKRHPFDMTYEGNYDSKIDPKNIKREPIDWYNYIVVPVIFITISIVLMKLITDPPLWLQTFLNGFGK